jgi:signal recognition particle receptor subunit beta
MVLFNYSTKELTAKVVYYGPGLCGKTTNLQWIHEKLPIKNKGKMLSLATETDRTLFFDFLPIELGTIRGMKTRIQLYTVPGQVFYNATRRMVLKGADCIVFVCDSQEAMVDANVESFENLKENLEVNEIDASEIPMVFQFNKRDLPNALPIEILNERLNPRGLPFYEAVAVKGVGVEETLKGVTGLVFRSLSAKYGGADTAPSPLRDVTPPVAIPRPPVPVVASTLPPLNMVPAPASTDELLDALELQPSIDEPDKASPGEPEEDIETLTVDDLAFDAPRPRDDPKTTLVKSKSESVELRRKIGLPPVPDVSLEDIEREMDEEDDEEEEIEDFSLESDDSGPDVTEPPLLPPEEEEPLSAPPVPPAPAPTLTTPLASRASPTVSSAVRTLRNPALETIPPAPAGSAEVSVDVPNAPGPTEVVIPLDVVVGGGKTQVNLQIRLILNLKTGK